MIITTHKYLGCDFNIVKSSDLFKVMLAGIEVTGTSSQSIGEAQMRFMLMLEAMQDFESKPIQMGDLVDLGDNCVGMITSIKDNVIEIREEIGDAALNYRAPNNVFTEDLSKFTYEFISTGVPYTIYETTKAPEWIGVYDVQFRANKGIDQGTFEYTRETNVWKL